MAETGLNLVACQIGNKDPINRKVSIMIKTCKICIQPISKVKVFDIKNTLKVSILRGILNKFKKVPKIAPNKTPEKVPPKMRKKDSNINKINT